MSYHHIIGKKTNIYYNNLIMIIFIMKITKIYYDIGETLTV